MALRKMKPVRQTEVAQLMLASNRYSQTFAEALLTGTRADMLAEPERKLVKALSPNQKTALEHETDLLVHDLKSAEASYGTDVLELSVTCRYVSNLLANGKVRHYIEGRFPDILAELEAVIALVESDSMMNAAPEL